MKIRTGFVSNSSSSSFCVCGIELRGRQKVLDFARKVGSDEEAIKKYEDYLNGNGDDYELDFAISRVLPSNFECTFHSNDDPLSIIVGRNYDSIGDEETGKEFRDSIETFFKEHGYDEKPYYICEEIYR